MNPGNKMNPPSKPVLVQHKRIQCDGCDKSLVGPRYRCIQCADYDLCAICEHELSEQKFHDATHVFIKIRQPSGPDFPKVTLARSTAPPAYPLLRNSPEVDLPDAINSFGFDLHKTLMGHTICPANVFSALLMVANGADGDTLAAVLKALNLPLVTADKIPSLNAQYAQLESRIFGGAGGENEEVDVKTASSIWYRQGLQPLARFEENMRVYFNSSSGPIDAAGINEFIRTKTFGRITTNYSPASFGDSILVLIACFFFKAPWETPFVRSDFPSSRFANFSGGYEYYTRMHQTAYFDYLEGDAIQAVFLNYKVPTGKTQTHPPCRWAAAVLLPKSPTRAAMQAVLESLTSESWAQLRGNVRRSKVHLTLPRFEIREGIDLTGVLTRKASPIAFTNAAEFSRINGTPMKVSSVEHMTLLKVDELGSEVAAVTVVKMLFGAAQEKIHEMMVDRPFLFLVFERDSGLVVCSSLVESLRGPDI